MTAEEAYFSEMPHFPPVNREEFDFCYLQAGELFPLRTLVEDISGRQESAFSDMQETSLRVMASLAKPLENFDPNDAAVFKTAFEKHVLVDETNPASTEAARHLVTDLYV